jgi:predicted NUDIX family NTP pyrophosphohydrolase
VAKRSSGILIYRRRGNALEVLLAHPGGPFWKKKDLGSWTIPKGEHGDDEDPLAAAQREFAEETGVDLSGEFIPLGSVRQAGGKIVSAWAVESNLDASAVHSNTFTMEWPPRSGRMQEFPEIDRAQWFSMEDARAKILASQGEFLDRLKSQVGVT